MARKGKEMEGIALLEDNELLIGQLYRQFAAKLPRQVRLWAGLAAEEMRHAWMLKTVRTRISAWEDSARFDVDALATFRDFMKGLLYGTLEKDLSAERALKTALYIQWSLQEQEIFRPTEGDPCELRMVLEALAAGSASHAGKLLKALRRVERNASAGGWIGGKENHAAPLNFLPVPEETFNHLGYFPV